MFQLVKIWLIFTIWVVDIIPAMAAEGAGDGIWRADPWWFPLLEIGGLLVILISRFIVQKASKNIGGVLGQTTYRGLKYALTLFLLAFLLRAFFEIRALEGLFFELVFEVLIYIGIIVLALAVNRFSQFLRNNDSP